MVVVPCWLAKKVTRSLVGPRSAVEVISDNLHLSRLAPTGYILATQDQHIAQSDRPRKTDVIAMIVKLLLRPSHNVQCDFVGNVGA